jgi:hypothetical protein
LSCVDGRRAASIKAVAYTPAGFTEGGTVDQEAEMGSSAVGYDETRAGGRRVRRSAAVTALLLVSALSACSSGPATAESGTPLPGCDAFVATLAGLGMPDPVLLTQGSPPVSQPGVTCKFAPRKEIDPPVLAMASIDVLRPNGKAAEQDPRKSYGDLIADADCHGIAAPDADLPGGTSCYQAVGDEIAMTTVSAVTRQSGIRVHVYWTEADVLPAKLKADALAKAHTLANAVLEKV